MSNPNVICLGEALIDFTPTEFGTSIIEKGELKMAAGGAPANVAVGLARLGCPTGFMGKVGADFFGRHLIDMLDRNGVDTSRFIATTKYNTGLAFVSWNERHEATYLFYRGPSADTMLEPADIDEEYLKSSRLLQFGSLMMATEPSGSAVKHALKIAAEAGLILCYDVNLRLNFWPSEKIALEIVSLPLSLTQMVKLNKAELEFLTGETDLETGCDKLWRAHFKLIVVTLDKEGCYYQTATARGYISALPATVVDTVGAGDGFLAGLIDGLWRENFAFDDQTVIEKACRQAVAVGSIVVGKTGGIPALPTRAEVEALLARQL